MTEVPYTFEVEVDGDGYIVETDESAMCDRCKEWAGVTYFLDKDFEVEEYVSGCCTAGVDHFHPSAKFEELVIQAAKEAVNG